MDYLDNLIQNSVFQIVILAAVVFLSIQFCKIWLYKKIESDWDHFQKSSLKTIETERDFYKTKSLELEGEVLAYYKGLGLPTYSQKRRLDALWERASQGDKDSYYILLELMNIDLIQQSKDFSSIDTN